LFRRHLRWPRRQRYAARAAGAPEHLYLRPSARATTPSRRERGSTTTPIPSSWSLAQPIRPVTLSRSGYDLTITINARRRSRVHGLPVISTGTPITGIRANHIRRRHRARFAPRSWAEWPGYRGTTGADTLTGNQRRPRTFQGPPGGDEHAGIGVRRGAADKPMSTPRGDGQRHQFSATSGYSWDVERAALHRPECVGT